MKLVEYDDSSSDESPSNINSQSNVKNSNSVNNKLDPCPAVQEKVLFSNLPSVSSKEISINLPLKDLEKPIQGVNHLEPSFCVEHPLYPSFIVFSSLCIPL